MDAQPQTGVDLPEMLDWHLFPGDNRSFVLVEGEGASKVETRLTVDWDERKISLDLTGDLPCFLKRDSTVSCSIPLRQPLF